MGWLRRGKETRGDEGRSSVSVTSRSAAPLSFHEYYLEMYSDVFLIGYFCPAVFLALTPSKNEFSSFGTCEVHMLVIVSVSHAVSKD